MSISTIANGEAGNSVRTKLNSAITVASNIQDNAFNVLDYDADNTGVADCTTEVVAAIDAAIAAGANSTVYFPAGTYNLASWSSKDIAIPLRFIGDGADISVLTGDKTANFLNLTTGAGLDMRGLSFDSWIRACIYPASATLGRVVIKGCKFYDFTLTSFGGSTTGLTAIDEFIFADNVCDTFDSTGSVYGVELRAPTSNHVEIRNNEFTNMGSLTKSAGRCHAVYIESGNSTDLTGDEAIENAVVGVTGNYIKNVHHNHAAADCTAITILGGRVTIRGNYIENCYSNDITSIDGEGIYIKSAFAILSFNILRNAGGNEGCIIVKGLDYNETPASNSNFSHNVVITNNSILQDKDYGVLTIAIKNTSSSNFVISNNTISGTAQGIVVNPDLIGGGTISANSIYNLKNWNAATNLVCGIRVSGPEKIFITDNFLNTITGGTVSAYGIYLVTGTGTYKGASIRGNSIRTVVADTAADGRGIHLVLDASGNCETLVVSDNEIEDAGYGINATSVTSTSATKSWLSGNLIEDSTVDDYNGVTGFQNTGTATIADTTSSIVVTTACADVDSKTTVTVKQISGTPAAFTVVQADGSFTIARSGTSGALDFAWEVR